MKVSDVLTDSSKWLQGAYAVTSDGTYVFSSDSRAAKRCLVGAVRYAYKSEREDGVCVRNADSDAVMDKIKEYLKVSSWSDIIVWQDRPETTWEDIIKLIKALDI
jgi:hypothetical protein